MKNAFAIKCMLLPLTIVAIGCQPTAPPANSSTSTEVEADAHAGHNHGHDDVGPHGGHLLHLEPSGVHAEWTHDDDAKLITVHLDDFDAAKITSAKFVVKIGDVTEEFPLTGTDTGWTITSEELLTHINMGDAAQVKFVVSDDAGEQSTKIEAHEHHHH